ncbi:MAG: Asp-tRNA(Asn)/Glu-tRNA(Gln) amidotransferase subunit GatA [bacterium]
MSLNELTIPRARELLDSGEITPRELTEIYLDRIDAVEDDVCAFERIDRAAALQRAESINLADFDSPLAGIPVAIKDNLCRDGYQTTCSSKILEGYIAPYTATAVKKLEEAGAIIVGNTNMDEFAMGSSTENSAHQTTHNPHDLNRVPGGSSGGSAAAVAAGEVPGALGSDTGGSVRQPASLCGVVGIKPTYGRVSRYGLIAFASSLDQIGPLARTVEGAAMLTEVISGHDSADSTSLPEQVPAYSRLLAADPSGWTVGIPREYFGEGIDPAVAETVSEQVKALERLGATVREVSLPNTKYAISVYYIIATAEASSNLARYDGVRYGYRAKNFDSLIDMFSRTREEGFGAEVKRRIMLGTFVLSSGYYEAYYGKAQKVRTLIKNDFDRVFKECDFLLTPTSPTTAFEIGSKIDDPVQMYMSDICTISANLAGVPAFSQPVGFDDRGLPVGAQLIGPPLSEEKLFQAAALIEKNSGWEPSVAGVKEKTKTGDSNG